MYIANIETQEDKVTELMGSFSEKLTTDMGGSLALNKISDALEGLMGQANGMRATCSLEQAIPEISAAHIKNISCPELFVSQHRAPGFYMQISRIVEFVAAHPVSGSYYVTHVLDTLKRNEPTCYASITSGKQPETLGEIFILLANRFLLPNATVLMTNGVCVSRAILIQPTSNHR